MSIQKIIQRYIIRVGESTEILIPKDAVVVGTAQYGRDFVLVYTLSEIPGEFERRWFHVVPCDKEFTIGGSSECVGSLLSGPEIFFVMLDPAPVLGSLAWGTTRVSNTIEKKDGGSAGGWTVGELRGYLARFQDNTRLLVLGRGAGGHDVFLDAGVVSYRRVKLAGTGYGRYTSATDRSINNEELDAVILHVTDQYFDHERKI